jgi:hypothetical protein
MRDEKFDTDTKSSQEKNLFSHIRAKFDRTFDKTLTSQSDNSIDFHTHKSLCLV